MKVEVDSPAIESSLPKIEFNIAYLKACSSFIASRDQKEEKLLATECIYLSDGFMVATNTVEILFIEDQVFKGLDYLLNGDDVENVCEESDLYGGVGICSLFIDEKNKQVSAVFEGHEIGIIRLMDYARLGIDKYKFRDDENRVIQSQNIASFNPMFLVDFLHAKNILLGDLSNILPSIRIVPSSVSGAIYLSLTSNSFGYLMPQNDRALADSALIMIEKYEAYLLTRYGVTQILWEDGRAKIFNFKPNFPKITAEEITQGWMDWQKNQCISEKDESLPQVNALLVSDGMPAIALSVTDFNPPVLAVLADSERPRRGK